MGKKYHWLCVMVTLPTLFLSSLPQTATGATAPLPKLKTAVTPQWENLQNLDLIPCPKEITLYDTATPIDDHLVIVIGKSASERSRTAAEDLQKIIQEQTSVKIQIMIDGEKTSKKNLIVLGTFAELPRIQQACKSAGISLKSVEQQGYAIFPFKDGLKQSIILAGKDEQGAYWAAMTLVSLIKDHAIRHARIIDWPDFKHRVCETLMQPMQLLFKAKSKAQKKAAWQAVKKGIRQAALLKFNYIRSFSILYSRPKTDYPLDIRAKMLGEVGKYANKRGIKLYVTFSTVVATEGDEKKFPQLKQCLKFLHLYVSWSDDQLIDHACEKITKMVKIIGPQQYFMHSPDVPYMGWNRRSESDRKRWGSDRIPAEAYLVNKIYKALKKGNAQAGFSYVSNPYHLGYLNDSPGKLKQRKIVERLSPKLPADLSLLWREGSLESAQMFRQLTKNQPQEYYIENSSFHKNRLLGGTARTAKTFYFQNSDHDFFYDNCNTSTHPVHQPQNGILAEYTWNTQAPGSLFIRQNNHKNESGSVKRMTVDGIPWGEWMTVYDLDGPLREELIPRTCRLFFGNEVGNTLALAYSVGSSINDHAMGGLATVPYDRRQQNSKVFAQRLAQANTEMAKLWDKPNLFHPGTYRIYQMAFKYVYIYQYLEKINASLMHLSWIAETGNDEDKVSALTDEVLAYIKTVRKNLAAGYEKYNFQSIRYAAIYRAKIGSLNNVNKKVDNLERSIRFKNTQIKMFGAGNLTKKKTSSTIGIASPPASFHLDGKLDEWDMASANLLDQSFYNRKLGMQGITGPKDVIAYWKTAWDKTYLYISVLIFDDKLSFPEHSPLYKNDAVELWINKQQFIFSINPDQKASVEPYCNYDTYKIKFATQRGKKQHRLHPDMKYWTLEIQIPVDSLQTPAKIGNRFYLALGVDDIDPGEKPTQLFFPDTYQHLNLTPGASPATNFALVVLQPKAKLTTTLRSSQITNIAKADGTYTCIDLKVALHCPEKIEGISSEILLYTKKGIKRFKVDVPNILKGNWVKTLQIVTDDLYTSDAGMDLIVRAPGYHQKFKLRDGKYRHLSLGPLSRNDSLSQKKTLASKEVKPLWGASFDNGSFAIQTKKGQIIEPVSSTDCTLVDSRKGQAVKIGPDGALVYKLSKPQLIHRGIIEFWLKPEYHDNDKVRRTFVHLTSANSSIRFIKNLSYSYMFIIYANGKANTVHVKTNRIKTGSWNYIALKWDDVEKSMQLNVNGLETTKNKINFSLNKPLQFLILGNLKRNGKPGCNSTIDEFKIQKKQ